MSESDEMENPIELTNLVGFGATHSRFGLKKTAVFDKHGGDMLRRTAVETPITSKGGGQVSVH